MICLFVLEFMTRFGRRPTDAIGHPGVETFAVKIDCPVPSRMAGKFGQQTSMRLIGHLSLDSRDADHAENFYFEVADEGLTECGNSAAEEVGIERALRSKHAQGDRRYNRTGFGQEAGRHSFDQSIVASEGVFMFSDELHP